MPRGSSATPSLSGVYGCAAPDARGVRPPCVPGAWPCGTSSDFAPCVQRRAALRRPAMVEDDSAPAPGYWGDDFRASLASDELRCCCHVRVNAREDPLQRRINLYRVLAPIQALCHRALASMPGRHDGRATRSCRESHSKKGECPTRMAEISYVDRQWPHGIVPVRVLLERLGDGPTRSLSLLSGRHDGRTTRSCRESHSKKGECPTRMAEISYVDRQWPHGIVPVRVLLERLGDGPTRSLSLLSSTRCV